MAKAVTLTETGIRARPAAPGLPWPLVRLLSSRQVRQHRAVTAVVSLAVAFTVASSFAVTAMAGAMIRGVKDRVGATLLPFDAVAMFTQETYARAFLSKAAKWEGRAQVEVFLWARAETPEGSVTVLGIAADLQPGEFRPVAPSLPDWRSANPSAVRAMPGAQEGALFSFTGAGDKDQIAGEVQKLTSTYPGTIVVTPRSGLALAESTSRRASLPWQAVSAGALLMSAAAVSCVLTVTFLGRKRTLGIMRVLGGTTADLQRLFVLETAFLGGVGLPLGFLLGFAFTARAFGVKAATAPCFLVSAAFGAAALLFGAYLPVRLVRNGSCDQLLNNRPVYAATNPSCAKCGLCGGF